MEHVSAPVTPGKVLVSGGASGLGRAIATLMRLAIHFHLGRC